MAQPITTLYLTGLPGDMTEREFWNLSAFLDGFVSAQLHFNAPLPSVTKSNSPQLSQLVGFIRFMDRASALSAMQRLEGSLIDPRGYKLKVQLAKKELFVKKEYLEAVQKEHRIKRCARQKANRDFTLERDLDPLYKATCKEEKDEFATRMLSRREDACHDGQGEGMTSTLLFPSIHWRGEGDALSPPLIFRSASKSVSPYMAKSPFSRSPNGNLMPRSPNTTRQLHPPGSPLANMSWRMADEMAKCVIDDKGR